MDQLFDFENRAVELANGEIFHPVEDSISRWSACLEDPEYPLSEIDIVPIVYELKNHKFVYVRFRGIMANVNGSPFGFRVDEPMAHEIDDKAAAELILDMGMRLPESLSKFGDDRRICPPGDYTSNHRAMPRVRLG